MSPALPFKAKMDTGDYMAFVQALRDDGRPLVEAHKIAETLHETFFKQPKYSAFETCKKEYYKRHVTKV